MNRIVLHDNFQIQMGCPAKQFLDGLARMVPGGKVLVAAALVVEFGDERLGELTRRLLDEAGVPFWMVGEEYHHRDTSPAEPGASTREEKAEETKEEEQVVIEFIPKPEREPGPLEMPAPEAVAKTAEKVQKALLGKTCPYCGEMYVPRRADQKRCTKDACKKAAKSAYMAKYWADHPAAGKNGKSHSDVVVSEVEGLPAPQPTDPDPTETHPEPPEPPVYEMPDYSRPWLIEDGPGAGQRISVVNLRRSLVLGSLKIGQHVRHQETGRHTVVKVTHGPGQKLFREFGGQPVYVLPGEL